MKQIALIILLLCSTAYGRILHSKSEGFDAFPDTGRRVVASAYDQTEVVMSIGTAEGQMLYWNDTTKMWAASDETKLKWNAATDTLTVTNVVIPGTGTSTIDGTVIGANSAASGKFTTLEATGQNGLDFTFQGGDIVIRWLAFFGTGMLTYTDTLQQFDFDKPVTIAGDMTATGDVSADNAAFTGDITDVTDITSDGDWLTSGQAAIGSSATINANRGLNLEFTGATTPNNNFTSLNILSGFSANTAAAKTGALIGVWWKETTYDHTSELNGLDARILMQTGTSGDLNRANAIEASINGSTGFTGSIAEYNGISIQGIDTKTDILAASAIRIGAITNSFAGSTNVGLLIEDVSGGAVANYAIKTGAGLWQNGDGIYHFQETTTPTAIPNYGAIYTKSNNELFFQDGAGDEHLLHGDAFSNLWFHSVSVDTVEIANQSEFVVIDSFENVGAEDDLSNVVGNTTNNDLTIGANGAGKYNLTFHASIGSQTSASEMVLTMGITLNTPIDVTGASNATPIVVTSVAHGLLNGDMVTIAGATTNTAANGDWMVTAKTADTFTLVDLEGTNSAGNGVYDASSGDVTIRYPGNLVMHREVGFGSLGHGGANADTSLEVSDKVKLYVANVDSTKDLFVAIINMEAKRIGD